MGILGRCRDILSSNINDLLDRAEDPVKMTNQMLRQAKEDLAQVQKETAAVMANETAAKRRLDECQAKVARYADAARNAVAQGKDDDARQLLASKQREEAALAGFQENYAQAHADAENMRAMFTKLTNDIRTLEVKADTLKAKASTAKAREHANKMSAGMKTGAALSRFAQMEEKVNKRLDTANAMADLDKGVSSDADLLAQYSGGGSSVDDELARLKAEAGLS